MYSRSTSIVVVGLLCLAVVAQSSAEAQTIHQSVEDIALRNGESVEFGNLYLIGADCKSLLISEPEVEIMDGPPGVAVAIRRAMIAPYEHGCEGAVLGGKMQITARDVEVYSYSRMILRITYKTQSGDLQRSQHINVALFP